MKTLVLSYSHTGNNAKLAKCITNQLEADFFPIREIKKRNIGTIIFDVLFNSTPQIQDFDFFVGKYDHVVLIGPVWIGKIASPFRAVFKSYHSVIGPYSFVTLCAGTHDDNPKIEEELERRAGKAPEAVVKLFLKDLFSNDIKVKKSEIDNLKITDKTAMMLANDVCKKLKANTYSKTA